MKFTFLLSFMILSQTLSSQCTITGQTYGKLIHAQNGIDTTINGDSVTAVYIWAGQSFNEIFQLNVLPDTTIVYGGTTTSAHITDMVLNNVSNIPRLLPPDLEFLSSKCPGFLTPPAPYR